MLNILILTACSVTVKTNNIDNRAGKISLRSLLYEMVDFRKLMETPIPNYKCIQFSSYDRRSTNVNLKTTSGWFANSDIGKYIRVETNNGRVEYVMADIEGPGAVVRIFSAYPQGIIRIYLDNASKPEIELTMSDMLYGRAKLFPPVIAGLYSIGGTSYMPIPFAKRYKITSSFKKVYYHVDCRLYKEKINVETFSLKQLKEESNLVEKINNIIKSPEKLLINTKNHRTISGVNIINPGDSFLISDHYCPVKNRKLNLQRKTDRI